MDYMQQNITVLRQLNAGRMVLIDNILKVRTNYVKWQRNQGNKNYDITMIDIDDNELFLFLRFGHREDAQAAFFIFLEYFDFVAFIKVLFKTIYMCTVFFIFLFFCV